jgi:cyclophilin family peptidyl-prolyl cis-trans isomerase/HEAT repeat protein
MRSSRLIPLALAFACARPTPAPRVPDGIESSLQAIELGRVPSAEARSLLGSREAYVRVRAALAMGRIGDPEATSKLAALLDDAEAGETAAWALGRIEGGHDALLRCLERPCPTAVAAARALSGPAAFQRPSVEALVAALSGAAAGEAATSLGVLARNKEARFPPAAYQALALAALHRGDARAGAAYALSRLPPGAGVSALPQEALSDADPWTRSLAARAWGRQGLPAAALRDALRDPDWRVRVEAARGLSTAAGAGPALQEAFAGQASPHAIVALSEAAAQLGVLPPEPASFADPASRCAVAQARDRIRKQLIDTPGCAEEGWRSRARVGALAAELGLPRAREAFRDGDGRVRGAAAGAVASAFADELRRLLADPDAFVVQEAAGGLSKLPPDPATKEAALTAVRRLAGAHARPAGDPESDAITALVALTGPLPGLLPTPNAALAAALGSPRIAVPVPAEARAMPRARLLRLRTSRGELVIDLRPDVAPLTSSALAALASRGFYDGLTFHRVVPDFVVQGGDPRGDGDGGPGWALPDEHSPLRFLRGTLGIATSGPETGGSQFFLCHSPQPHLDGRYTVAGQLRSGEDVLDALQPGDTILAATAE